MRRSDALVLISTVVGLSVIGAGMSCFKDIINDLDNGPKDVAYRSLLRLGDTLTPSTVTPQNFDMFASMSEQIRETLLSLEAIRTSITLNAHQLIDMLTRLDNWGVVVSLGLIIAVAATVGSSYINN